MALQVTSGAGQMQGSNPLMQGSSPYMQGSSPNLQPTAAPGMGQNLVVPSTQSAPVHPGAVPGQVAPGATGFAGTTFNQPEYLQGIQQEYGNSIQAAQNQIAGQNSYLPTAQNDVNSTAQASQDQANKTATDTLGQLGQQASNTQSQQRLSLAELADQIHGQNQGLMNQLGASGAGFSSAMQTGQQALQHAQNAQAANVNSQANAGLANINQEKQTTNDTLQTAMEGINSWKQTQLDSILNNYQQTMAQLNGALGTAQGEEKARLAMYGQQLQASAATALGDLQNKTQEAVQRTQAGLQQAQSARPAAVQFAAPTAPTNITYDNTSPFAGSTNAQGNATSAAQPPSAAPDASLAALAAAYKTQQQPVPH